MATVEICDMGFRVSRRCPVVGPGWQVRVRDLRNGHEATEDILHSLAEAQAMWDRLALCMRSLGPRPI